MIRAVLFDLGGTLHVSSSTPARKVWFASRIISRLDEYGIRLDISPEVLSSQLERNAVIYKREAEESMREKDPVIVWNDYYLREQALGYDMLSPVAEELSFLYDYERVCNMRRPDMLQCLNALRDMGMRLGMISNMLSRTLVPHFLAEYGIDGMMECVLTSAGTGIRKPDPEIFRLAEKRMGLRPDEMAYVGDTLSRDVRGTHAAGWKTVIQI